MACSSPNRMLILKYHDEQMVQRTTKVFMGKWEKDRVSQDTFLPYDGESFWRDRQVPCRRCTPCRKRKSLDSATRCVLEMRYHQVSGFFTFTYNKESVPKDGSLRYRDFQLFIKKLRKHIYPQRIRFFMCGEYGARRGRPHYHAIIFGYVPDDLVAHPRKEHGHTVFRSASLAKLWKHGYVTVGEANVASARYVASYIHKKINGALADSVYKGKRPEFVNSSKRPAIGRQWFEDFAECDVLAYDELILEGKRVPMPEYFNRLAEKLFPERYGEISLDRDLKSLARNDAMILEGNSPIARAKMGGIISELNHAQTFRRSYEQSSEDV